MTIELPNCKELEFQMIAYLANNGTESGNCFEQLEGDDFYLEETKACFEGMKSLHAKGKSCDLESLSHELRELRLYDLAAKEKILQKSFIAISPISDEIDFYIEKIKSKAHARRLYYMAENLKAQASQPAADGFVLGEEFEKKILQMMGTKRARTAEWIIDLMMPMSNILEERARNALQSTISYSGTPSGFKDLDAILDGFKPGNLTILGARPGVGKTSLLLNLLQNISFKGEKKIGFFSLEMPNTILREKLLSQKTLIPFERIRRGTYTKKEQADLDKAIADWSTKLILMDDQAGLTMQQLKTRCYRLKDKGDVGLVMIDYLQLLRISKRSNSKYEEITEISKELKILAKEIDAPIICLAQLNREVENRPDGKPRKSDLRDSGGLEQDADEIILLYNDKENANVLNLLVDKNRFGREGEIKLYFDKSTGKISDLQKEEKLSEAYKHWME